MVVDLEQLIADKVHQRIQAMNGTVEEIVAREVDREIGRRIAELLEAELEGRTNPQRVADLEEPPAPRTKAFGPTKVCTNCGEEKPLDGFEPGRGRCRACRREQVRQRRQQQEPKSDDQERPRTDGQAS